MLFQGSELLDLFNFFGPSESLKALDQASREFDVHPRLVPETVKLTTIRLIQKSSDAEYILHDEDYNRAAEMLSFSILGFDQFVASNTPAGAERSEQRLEEAIDAGDSMDTQLILLASHAGILHPTIADQVDSQAAD